MIAREVFTFVKDLYRKVMCHIRSRDKDPKSMKWRYSDPSRRIPPAFGVSVTRN